MAAPEPSAPASVARVSLANINPGTVSSAFTLGVINCMNAATFRFVYINHSGPYLDHGRNVAVSSILAQQDAAPDPDHAFDWLLFVDSDIEFGPEHVDTLLAPTLHPDYDPAAYPIIGGVYYNPYGATTDDIRPVVFDWREDRPPHWPTDRPPVYCFPTMTRSELSTRAPVNEFWNPDGAVCAVGAVGTGFLAIHTDYLRTMREMFSDPTHWFAEPTVNGILLGEDIGFCYRAMAMGYPVLVNRACVVLHHKTMKLV